jgi:hypothetical protein
MDADSMMAEVFDDGHYASTLGQKIKRSFQLGPKYYSFDIPRYLLGRRALKLPVFDWDALWSPLREFGQKRVNELPLPNGYPEVLGRLRDAGVRLTIPRHRLEGLLTIWWSTREVRGDVIECGSYRGATALLLALLGKINQIDQATLMLDTFAGMPQTSKYDVSRQPGEFLPPEGQVAVIRRQAESLGVADRTEIHQGLFHDSFRNLAGRRRSFAFVHIDANIYEGTLEACQFTIPRIVEGGAVVFDDYNGPCDLGARLAIEQFCAGQKIKLMPLAGSSVWARV